MSTLINLIRLAVFAAVSVFSIIVLGIAAHMISVTVSTIGFYWTFAALGIATACLTIFTLPGLAALSIARKGALPNFIVVEAGWLTLLWILWLSTAAHISNATSILPTSCDFDLYIRGKTIACREFQAFQAFAWLNWIMLIGYTAFSIVLAFIQQLRGNIVWNRSVNDVDLFAPSAIQAGMVGEKPMQPGMMPQQQIVPQQVGTPQQQVPQQLSYTPQSGYTNQTGAHSSYPQV